MQQRSTVLLRPATWQQTDRIIEYGHWDGAGPGQGNFIAGYDDNGSVTEKLTWDTDGTTEDRSDDSILEEITYEYNLQNRLESITRVGEWINLDSDSEDDDREVEVTQYTYNVDGIRISSEYTFYEVIDYGETSEESTPQSYKLTTYLVDPYNHTGYAQVFVEDDGTNKTSYIISAAVLIY